MSKKYKNYRITGGIIYKQAVIDTLNIQNYKCSSRIQLQLFFIRFLIPGRHTISGLIIDITDIFHVWLTLSILRLLKCINIRHIDIIVICHHFEIQNIMRTRIEKWILHLFADRIVVPSQTIADQLELSKYKTHILHPPLRFKIHSPKENINDKKLIQLLYVGNLSERKNIKYYVDILDKLPPRYYLTIVTSSIPDTYQYLTKHLRIHMKVGLTDQQVSNKYRQADLLLFLSKLEGFGMVNIESMAHGTPVIASDIPVHREVMNSGVYGKLVPLDAYDKVA